MSMEKGGRGKAQCDVVVASDGQAQKGGWVDTRYKRGIHTTTGRRRTIDNRRCISFDLPNIAKKTLTTVHYWMSA